MQINFASGPRADFRSSPCSRARRHRARPGQAEHLIRRGDAGAAKAARAAARAKGAVSVTVPDAPVRLDPAPARPAAPAAPARPCTPWARADLDDQRGDGGMQMEMLVGVDMVERQAGGGERRRTAPRSRLRAGGARLGRKNIAAPARAMSLRKLPSRRPDRAPARAGRTGLPSTSTRCRPTRSDGMAARARHRIGGGRARHHQAGGGENAVPMRALDRVIDFDGGAEIVA